MSRSPTSDRRDPSPQPPERADLLVEGGTLVTVDPQRWVIHDGAVSTTGAAVDPSMLSSPEEPEAADTE